MKVVSATFLFGSPCTEVLTPMEATGAVAEQATLAAKVGQPHDSEELVQKQIALHGVVKPHEVREALETGVTSSFAIATAAAIRCVWFEVKGGEERWLHIDSH